MLVYLYQSVSIPLILRLVHLHSLCQIGSVGVPDATPELQGSRKVPTSLHKYRHADSVQYILEL